jgi:hypothetical protein
MMFRRCSWKQEDELFFSLENCDLMSHKGRIFQVTKTQFYWLQL